MKCNTFTLKCFLQFTFTNLDGSQKEGGNLLQKESGIPSENVCGGRSNPGGNYGITENIQQKLTLMTLLMNQLSFYTRE